MENQSFHLIQGLAKKCKVHKLVYDGRGSVWSFYLGLKKKVKKILKQNPGIQLVHCNDGTIGLMCDWLNDLSSIKTAVTLHGLDVVYPMDIFQNSLIKRLRRYDCVIAVSEATKQECLNRAFTPDKVFCIPNGVDHDIAEIPTNKMVLENLLESKGIEAKNHRYVVSMGRAVKRKGFSWFIESVLPKLPNDVLYLIIGPFKKKNSFTDHLLNILPKRMAKSIALLFGVPTDQATIRELLKDKNTASRVCVLGKLPFKDLLSVISLSNVFVMPNIRVEGDMEGFGLVALEACMRGTTVLASKIEGIQDAIIDGKNGFLVESENIDQWKTAIIKNLEITDDVSSRNKAFVEYTLQNYSWNKMSESYFQLFQSFLEKK